MHQIARCVRLHFNALNYRTPHFYRDIEVMWALEDDPEVQVGDDRCTVWEGEMVPMDSEQPHEIKVTGKSCALLRIQVLPDLMAEDVPELEHIYFDQYFVNGLPQEICKDIEQTLLDAAW